MVTPASIKNIITLLSKYFLCLCLCLSLSLSLSLGNATLKPYSDFLTLLVYDNV
jgi:hypothetical protein